MFTVICPPLTGPASVTRDGELTHFKLRPLPTPATLLPQVPKYPRGSRKTMGDLDLDTSNRGELAVSVATPEISAAINEQRKIEAQLNPVLQDSDRESRILNDLDQNLAVKLAAFYERINPRFDGLEGRIPISMESSWAGNACGHPQQEARFDG